MDMMPPSGYDHQPTVQVEDHVLTSDVVNRICWEKKTAGPDGKPPSVAYRFLGCAHLSAGRCEVWRIDDVMVRRHEYAHCNGWPNNHPTFYVAPITAAKTSIAPTPVAAKPAAPLYGVKTATDLTPKMAPWPMPKDMAGILPERGYWSMQTVRRPLIP